jgi:hypothetical protein
MKFLKNTYRHLLSFLSLGYILNYWGNSEYAQNTKLFPSSMMANLMDVSVFWIMIVYTIPAIIIATDIEFRQKIKNPEVKVSKQDIITSILGMWLSIPLEKLIHNIFLIPVFLTVIILSIIYFKKQIK